MRNGRRFRDLCKDFGWSQSEGDKSGHLIHDCAFQCTSPFNANGIVCVYRCHDAFSHDSNFSLTSDSSVLSLTWESRIVTWRKWYLLSLCLPGTGIGATLPYLTETWRSRGAIWAVAGLGEPKDIIPLNHSGSLEGPAQSLIRQTLQLDHRVSLLCPSRQILWRVSFSESLSKAPIPSNSFLGELPPAN